MKSEMPDHSPPKDADARRAIAPVICYPPETLPKVDVADLRSLRAGAVKRGQTVVAPRDGACMDIPAGDVFRIVAPEGGQVGDMNLWAQADVSERFYSGKTRALHGTHLSTGDRLWSSFPHLRPMATIIDDSLDWYGFDEYGGSVHDVIGTRCDPYTGRLLSGTDYHSCCHSNLTRALAAHLGRSLQEAEPLVHDVLNVFMCTGFTRDTGQYFMKASPVRAGDYLEFYAQIDLIVGLSACPGGDCSAEHSSDSAVCHPLIIEHWDMGAAARAAHRVPPRNAYDGSHGVEGGKRT